MIARLIIGTGLFALGYFVGKEMGRAESIRDQLRWAAEGEDLVPTKLDPEAEIGSETSDPAAARSAS
jgi:hypothetical protein